MASWQEYLLLTTMLPHQTKSNSNSTYICLFWTEKYPTLPAGLVFTN